MKVVDASAMIESLSHTVKSPHLGPLLDDDLFAPDLLVVEVVNFFRTAMRRNLTDRDRAVDAIDAFRSAPIEFVAIWPMTSRIWELRDNVSAYDACYVALAEELGCPLLTCDVRLARAPGLRVPVITV